MNQRMRRMPIVFLFPCFRKSVPRILPVSIFLYNTDTMEKTLYTTGTKTGLPLESLKTLGVVFVPTSSISTSSVYTVSGFSSFCFSSPGSAATSI
jgi:hypothetical protein